MADIYRHGRAGVGRAQASGRWQRVLRRGAAFSGLAATAAVVAACGSAGGSTAGSGSAAGGGSNTNNGSAAGAEVSARQLSGVGSVLVNKSGRTIYSVKSPSEANGNIKCTGSCTTFWFPVTGSASLSASGLPGKLGSVSRPDGTKQLTYNGMPLYTFKLDTAPGQDHGNNFRDSFNGTNFTWQVVTASGKPAGGSTPAPSNTGGNNYGGGY
jgi:predicted lipoprotein with Yx(FWY)xxD motif